MSSVSAARVDTKLQQADAVPSDKRDDSGETRVERPKKEPKKPGVFTFDVPKRKAGHERKVSFAEVLVSPAAHASKQTRSHDPVDALSAKEGIAVASAQKPVSRTQDAPKKVPTTIPAAVIEHIENDDDFTSKVSECCKKIRSKVLALATLETGIQLYSFGYTDEMGTIDLLTKTLKDKWIADPRDDKALTVVVKYHLLFRKDMKSLVKRIDAVQ